MHHKSGKMQNPKIAQNGPAAETLPSEPKGPPETEKNIRDTNPHICTGRWVLDIGVGTLGLGVKSKGALSMSILKDNDNL